MVWITEAYWMRIIMDDQHEKPLDWTPEPNEETFRSQLEHLINRFSMENGCNTPDFILADYLADCLQAFDKAVNRRDTWHGVEEMTIPGIANPN
jgi:hypothetical protein